MGRNERHAADRAVGVSEQWLGKVRRLAPTDAASSAAKGLAPEWSPGALALGYFLAGQLRGVAHLLPLKRTARIRAEVKISVEEQWQHCGIGTLLMQALLQEARQLGIEEVYLRCHVLNRPMQQLAERFGAEIGFEDCQAYGRIRLTAPACVREC